MAFNADRFRLELRRSVVPFLLVCGLGICGAVAGWIIFKNQVFQRPWVAYYDVRAQVDDAKGVVPGKQEVRIAGVKVGVITKSQLVDGQPVLTLSLEPKYAPIYRDAKVRLRPVTPLQDMYVAIDRGTPKAGPLGKDETLPAEASTTPVDVSRVLQTFDDDTRRRLHGLLHAIGPGLRDNGAQLNRSFVAIAPFLQEARRLAAVLSDRRRAVERAVTNFGVLTEALGSGDRQLARLVRNGEETLSELASRDHALSGLLAELPRVLGSLQRSMTTLGVAQGDLDPALEDLRPVAAKLEQSLRSMERLGVALRPAAEALAPAVRGLRPLARDVRPTSSSLVGAFAELGAQAKSYDTLTKEVLPCREMARDFYSNTPSVFKFGNAFGAFPRGDLSFAPQSAGGFGSANLTRASSCTDGNGKTGGRK